MTSSKNKLDPLKLRWIAHQGSVFTEQVFEKKTDAGVFVRARISVAFNVGDDVARHIADTHNAAMRDEKTYPELEKLRALLESEFECYRTHAGLIPWAITALLDNSPHRMNPPEKDVS